MKRWLLAILWTFLLTIGMFGMFVVWTMSGVPLWMEIIIRLPLAMWAIWTFFMIYDVWSSVRGKRSVPTFTEAPRVDVKTGALLYVNDVLYRFTEMSQTMEFDGTSSRIILESVDTRRGGIRTIRVTPPEEFKGPMVTPRDQDPDF